MATFLLTYVNEGESFPVVFPKCVPGERERKRERQRQRQR